MGASKVQVDLVSLGRGDVTTKLKEAMEPKAGVKVGILFGTGAHTNAENGALVSEIAHWNEFGTDRNGRPHILPRPFLRPTIRENSAEYKLLLKKLLKKVLLFQIKERKALSIIGLRATADVKNAITALSTPENAKATKQAKGSSNPLIDTGELRKSINWALVRRGE